MELHAIPGGKEAEHVASKVKSHLPEWLTKKYGPLPGWGWIVAGVGGYFLARAFTSKMDATKTDSSLTGGTGGAAGLPTTDGTGGGTDKDKKPDKKKKKPPKHKEPTPVLRSPPPPPTSGHGGGSPHVTHSAPPPPPPPKPKPKPKDNGVGGGGGSWRQQ